MRRVREARAIPGGVELVPFDDRGPAHGAIGFAQFLEPPARFPLVHMQPDLQKIHALVAQHLLGANHILQHVVIGGAVEPAERAIAQGAMMPGTEHQADSPLGRHVAPIAPGPGPRAFLVGRGAIGEGFDEMVVEPVIKPVDHFALAGAVGAVDQHHDGGPLLFGDIELRVEQPLPQRRLKGRELGLGHDMRQGGGLEHGAS